MEEDSLKLNDTRTKYIVFASPKEMVKECTADVVVDGFLD